MSSTAPDLSGLDPFINAFVVVAVIGAVLSLVFIGQALVAFAATARRAQVAHPARLATR